MRVLAYGTKTDELLDEIQIVFGKYANMYHTVIYLIFAFL